MNQFRERIVAFGFTLFHFLIHLGSPLPPQCCPVHLQEVDGALLFFLVAFQVASEAGNLLFLLDKEAFLKFLYNLH